MDFQCDDPGLVTASPEVIVVADGCPSRLSGWPSESEVLLSLAFPLVSSTSCEAIKLLEKTLRRNDGLCCIRLLECNVLSMTAK